MYATATSAASAVQDAPPASSHDGTYTAGAHVGPELFACKTNPTQPLTDEAHERAIEGHRIASERHMALRQAALQQYKGSSCLADLGEADRQLLLARQQSEYMTALIRRRSPAQIARMQTAQAERMALEPGATRGASGA